MTFAFKLFLTWNSFSIFWCSWIFSWLIFVRFYIPQVNFSLFSVRYDVLCLSKNLLSTDCITRALIFNTIALRDTKLRVVQIQIWFSNQKLNYWTMSSSARAANARIEWNNDICTLAKNEHDGWRYVCLKRQIEIQTLQVHV